MPVFPSKLSIQPPKITLRREAHRREAHRRDASRCEADLLQYIRIRIAQLCCNYMTKLNEDRSWMYSYPMKHIYPGPVHGTYTFVLWDEDVRVQIGFSPVGIKIHIAQEFEHEQLSASFLIIPTRRCMIATHVNSHPLSPQPIIVAYMRGEDVIFEDTLPMTLNTLTECNDDVLYELMARIPTIP